MFDLQGPRFAQPVGSSLHGAGNPGAFTGEQGPPPGDHDFVELELPQPERGADVLSNAYVKKRSAGSSPGTWNGRAETLVPPTLLGETPKAAIAYARKKNPPPPSRS